MHGRMAGLLGLSREGAWTRTRERKPEDQTQRFQFQVGTVF